MMAGRKLYKEKNKTGNHQLKNLKGNGQAKADL